MFLLFVRTRRFAPNFTREIIFLYVWHWNSLLWIFLVISGNMSLWESFESASVEDVPILFGKVWIKTLSHAIMLVCKLMLCLQVKHYTYLEMKCWWYNFYVKLFSNIQFQTTNVYKQVWGFWNAEFIIIDSQTKTRFIFNRLWVLKSVFPWYVINQREYKIQSL